MTGLTRRVGEPPAEAATSAGGENALNGLDGSISFKKPAYKLLSRCQVGIALLGQVRKDLARQGRERLIGAAGQTRLSVCKRAASLNAALIAIDHDENSCSDIDKNTVQTVY